MSYHLYVRPMPPFPDSPADSDEQLFNWVLLDASGDAQARGVGETRTAIEQTLAQNALESVRLIGLIPGDEALFCWADIPARQERHIRQALPYAVEEQLAQDIDSMHLALGQREAPGFRVAAIDHQRMAAWSALFNGWAHVRLEAIMPDAALLPAVDEDWTICMEGDTALLASKRGEWLRMHIDNLMIFADTLAMPAEDEVTAEVRVTLFGTQADLDKQAAVVSTLQGSERLVVRQQVLELIPLELLAHAHHHHMSHAINLCQGSYGIRTEGGGALRPWRPLIAVACLWLVLQLGVEVGLGFYRQQQADNLEQQAMSIYRQAFPGNRSTTINNVRRVLEGEFRVAGEQGSNAGFLYLMKATGQQYAALPDHGSVQFNNINYSRARGELVVDLKADNFNKLNALRSGLTKDGLQAEIGSVVNEASGARGRLTISGG